MSGGRRGKNGWAQQSGFTLIELLTVIIIIAILAAIAIPTYGGSRLAPPADTLSADRRGWVG